MCVGDRTELSERLVFGKAEWYVVGGCGFEVGTLKRRCLYKIEEVTIDYELERCEVCQVFLEEPDNMSLKFWIAVVKRPGADVEVADNHRSHWA